jgi:hypothetical protein
MSLGTSIQRHPYLAVAVSAAAAALVSWQLINANRIVPHQEELVRLRAEKAALELKLDPKAWRDRESQFEAEKRELQQQSEQNRKLLQQCQNYAKDSRSLNDNNLPILNKALKNGGLLGKIDRLEGKKQQILKEIDQIAGQGQVEGGQQKIEARRQVLKELQDQIISLQSKLVPVP